MTGINPTSTTTHHNIKTDKFNNSFKTGDLYIIGYYNRLRMGIVVKETPLRIGVFEIDVDVRFIDRKYGESLKECQIQNDNYYKIAYIGNYHQSVIINDISSLPKHFMNMSVFLKQRLLDYHQHLKYKKQTDRLFT